MTRGVLHLVVGPSGAGKDTLIDAARAARPDILFPARLITRAADAGGEAHEAIDEAAFAARAAAGGFALWWRAHGLGYGIPATIEAALASGRHVVVNASRSVVDAARARFAPVRVLHVTAPPETLAARLGARARERGAALAERLAPRAEPAPVGADVIEIDNGGAVAEGAARFLAALAPPGAAG